jgi:hypothetical protein
MRRFVFLLAFLAGCTSIAHEKVEGWPKLRVTERYVPAEVMRERCGKYVGFGMMPLACAEFDLARGTCDIWLSEDFAPRKVIEHERKHCEGYDHAGASGLKEFLARYRAWEASQPSLASGSAAAGR